MRKQVGLIHISLQDLVTVPNFGVQTGTRAAKQKDSFVAAEICFHLITQQNAAGGQVLDPTPQVPLADADGLVAAVLEHILVRLLNVRVSRRFGLHESGIARNRNCHAQPESP